MNNGILLAAVGLGAFFLLSKKKSAATPPDVSSFGSEIGKNVLDAWKSEQGKKDEYSYDPVSGQRVAECASKLRMWNPKLQRWECTPLNPGKDEEAEVRF
jgi:hypothetical protein